MTEQDINRLIQEHGLDTNLISDGYHSFQELYEHRIALYIALCRHVYRQEDGDWLHSVWRSKKHSDGSEWKGWFILGIDGREEGQGGKQITYHLPMSEWENTMNFLTLEKAPPFDGHSSQDVLERIKALP